ncbi:gamma-glutamylcyclotransferase family protein [Nocardiopsis sp. NRRL B-16309]|uniref:gamma-glutamylcyclotransferase family protein n=1 Tax=Nocardiopsis sp. NRRL B-16309 TaxID=1519494 RepID=UPI0006AF451F|nr:gamma-glutamylcyclotransferase family protein [Nocardiopsis sp. NRRL B-16309]KOX16012.1 gamma-glutamyl cyclotransferase [Nocardiopsis sp. NRRL B-16309]
MDRLSERRQPLFVYGTLLFPQILRALLGRVPDSAPAAAPGWRAAPLAAHPYPALVPASGTASGRLLSELTEAECRVIDTYEGDGYDVRRLSLVGGEEGWGFVADGPVDAAPGDWDPDAFAAEHLDAYVEACTALRARLLPSPPA